MVDKTTEAGLYASYSPSVLPFFTSDASCEGLSATARHWKWLNIDQDKTGDSGFNEWMNETCGKVFSRGDWIRDHS